MAKAPKAAGEFDELDDESHYAVTLKKPFQIGRTWLRPGIPATLKGKIIKEKTDFIDGVSPVTS